MKHPISLVLVMMVFLVSGCDIIGDIFGAGFYTGIIVVVLVLALLGYLAYRIFKR